MFRDTALQEHEFYVKSLHDYVKSLGAYLYKTGSCGSNLAEGKLFP